MKHLFLVLFCLSALTSYSQNIFYEDMMKFTERIAARDSLMQESKLKDKELIGLLSANNADKDSIVTILKTAKTAYEDLLADYKHEIEIKDFFFCGDTTVFGSNFIEVTDIESYPPYLQEYYQLVLVFRDIDKRLTEVKRIIDGINMNEMTKDLPLETKKEVLQSKLESKLFKLEESFHGIKESDIFFLSPEQKGFYNDYLKPRYNGFIDTLYNNSNNGQQ